MTFTFGRTALVLLISLLLAGCFSAEASLLKKTHESKKNTLRGVAVAKTTSGDDDDDTDDDDDDDEDDDKSEKKENHLVESHVNKEVDHVKHELAENMKQQLELQDKIKHLSDEARSDQEIDAAAGTVGKETESPAMANMLGKMWKEMRMFKTPFYAEHVEEEIHHLKHEQHALEVKLAAEQSKASISMEESESDEHEHKKGKKEEKEDVEESSQGAGSCPCIGINELEGETVATLKNGKKVPYPADLGGECKAWDEKEHPSCTEGSGAPWCKQKWCYVDPCNCKSVGVLPKPSIYLPGGKYQGKPVHFSYATCGGKDSYSSEKEKKKTAKDIEKTCAVEVDSSKWGAENCRCVGIAPQPGTTKVSIKDRKVDFPADTGAMCNAWEKDNHPDCDSDDAPDWCNQAWCYVDPCSCKLPTPPKTSSYLPDASYQSKPVYFSYATCGGKDSYTSGNKKACVNAKTSGACGQLEKCSWTGKECLGKDLVNTCGLENKSGSWSPKTIVAFILPVFVLLH